jgi:hypothetical protein
VLKEGIATAMADGQSFITGLRQTVAAYRSTSHAVTGVSPASIMLAFPLKTPLTTLQTQQQTTNTTASANIKRRVWFKQEAMADRHDRRYHTVKPQFEVGDWIRVKLPTRAHKLAPVFSEPFEIAKAAGNTVWLTNGKRWNVRRCIKYRSSVKSPTPVAAPSVAAPTQSTVNEEDDDVASATFSFPVEVPVAVAAEQNGPRRSARNRRPRDLGPVIRY